jgi:hypothetical protein
LDVEAMSAGQRLSASVDSGKSPLSPNVKQNASSQEKFSLHMSNMEVLLNGMSGREAMLEFRKDKPIESSTEISVPAREGAQ